MKQKNYSLWQLSALTILRFLIGWHLLYEGISKLLTPGWTSVGFLRESQWVLSGFAKWVLSNQGVVPFVDFFNIWGLIAIGFGLIMGLFTRAAAVSGTLLLLLYYFNNAPVIGIEYSIPSEGSNLLISKTLVEAGALFVLSVFPTGSLIGLDRLFSGMKNTRFSFQKKAVEPHTSPEKIAPTL